MTGTLLRAAGIGTGRTGTCGVTVGLSLGLSVPVSVTADAGKDMVLPDMPPEVEILDSGRGGTGGGRFRLIGTGGGSLVEALGVLGAVDMGREAAGLSINPTQKTKQQSHAIAKMTARCAL